jgi:phage repressor protein C with HTH and peptisase S24 domain
MLTEKVNPLTALLGKLSDMTPKDLAERAKTARIRAGYAKESDAAKAIGCSRPLVIRWESGEAKSIGSYLLAAARAYKVRPQWLTLESDNDGWPWLPEGSSSVASSATPAAYVRFPLLEGFAGFGRGDYVGDYPEIVDFVEVTREWASQKLRGVPLETIRVITGRGDSMRGQYNDGDLVFIDARVKKFTGDSAYCYRWNGMVQIKRLQLVGKGIVRILSKNPDYPSIDVSIDELEIGGRALAAWTLTEF